MAALIRIRVEDDLDNLHKVVEAPRKISRTAYLLARVRCSDPTAVTAILPSRMRPNLGLIVELSFLAALLNLAPEAGAQSAGILGFATTSFNSFEADTNALVLVIRV